MAEQEIDLARMREIAERAQKATGAWRLRRRDDALGWAKDDRGLYGKYGYIVRPGNHAGMFNDHDAAEHIVTFDPPTVLALLDILAAPSSPDAAESGAEQDG